MRTIINISVGIAVGTLAAFFYHEANASSLVLSHDPESIVHMVIMVPIVYTIAYYVVFVLPQTFISVTDQMWQGSIALANALVFVLSAYTVTMFVYLIVLDNLKYYI